MTLESFSRPEFLVSSAVGAATVALATEAAPAAEGKKTFSILHTNDLHSNFLGMSAASDYSPFTPNDDSIVGDKAIANEIEAIKQTVTEVVFASRGYRIDQPLAVAPRDLPNTYTDKRLVGAVKQSQQSDELSAALQAKINWVTSRQ